MISIDYILGVINGIFVVENYLKGDPFFMVNTLVVFLLLISIISVSEDTY